MDDYLERRGYVDDVQKLPTRRFSQQPNEDFMKTPKRLLPIEGASPLKNDSIGNKRAQSYLSNGPNKLEPIDKTAMSKTG